MRHSNINSTSEKARKRPRECEERDKNFLDFYAEDHNSSCVDVKEKYQFGTRCVMMRCFLMLRRPKYIFLLNNFASLLTKKILSLSRHRYL